jgi:CheY-like chemotaxis protein
MKLMNILVIDDELEITAELRDYLNRKGHHVVEADGVEAALQALAGNVRFDLILADMRLPTGTGEDVLRVCQRVLDPAPAVVLMTGVADECDVRRAKLNGALTVYRKPIVPRQLTEALQLATHHRPGHPLKITDVMAPPVDFSVASA